MAKQNNIAFHYSELSCQYSEATAPRQPGNKKNSWKAPNSLGSECSSELCGTPDHQAAGTERDQGRQPLLLGGVARSQRRGFAALCNLLSHLIQFFGVAAG